MQTAITFNTENVTLEGRLRVSSTDKAVIITHPHPLYGGDMNNAVVAAVAQAYARESWTTLCFNFRGTGNSTGRYEEGIGEQKDIQAAIDYLNAKEFKRIELAGYSFGAWVLAGWSRNNAPHPHTLVLVAPPVAFADFDPHSAIPGLRSIFVGRLDNLAPVDRIKSALPRWNPEAQLCVIQGADHFFGGHLQTLQHEIVQGIRSAPTAVSK